jgi:proton-translocating NADH-quinone oxidoreductase chain N
MNLPKTLSLLSPELVLLVTGLLVLILDLSWRDQKKPWLPYVALGGLAANLMVIGVLWNQEVTSLEGMYTVDRFALLFKSIAVITSGLVILVSMEFMQAHTHYDGEFYGLLLFATLAISLIPSATNLILIYFTIEMVSITSYILTGFLRYDPKSSEAAIKYFFYGAVASAVMLYGMSLLFGATGSTSLSGIAAIIQQRDASIQGVIYPAVIFMLVGLGFKISAVPFHQWAPDAYEGAPTPVTAFLSVGPKASGFAALTRIFLIALPSLQLERTYLFAIIAAATMTLGNLVAIWQSNIKRLLAYSSIAQAGYLLLGIVASRHNTGIASLIFYLFVYLFANLGAFTIVIIVSNGDEGESLDNYAGLSRRSPLLALAMLLFLLSLAGIPPMAGFIGKVYLFAAIMQDGLIGLLLVAILNSVVSLYYYLKIARQMYILPPKTDKPIRLSRALFAALFITLIGVLLLGLYPNPMLVLIQTAPFGFMPK